MTYNEMVQDMIQNFNDRDYVRFLENLIWKMMVSGKFDDDEVTEVIRHLTDCRMDYITAKAIVMDTRDRIQNKKKINRIVN